MWSIVVKGGKHFLIGDGWYTIAEAVKELKIQGVITYDDEVLSVVQQVQD